MRTVCAAHQLLLRQLACDCTAVEAATTALCSSWPAMQHHVLQKPLGGSSGQLQGCKHAAKAMQASVFAPSSSAGSQQHWQAAAQPMTRPAAAAPSHKHAAFSSARAVHCCATVRSGRQLRAARHSTLADAPSAASLGSDLTSQPQQLQQLSTAAVVPAAGMCDSLVDAPLAMQQLSALADADAHVADACAATELSTQQPTQQAGEDQHAGSQGLSQTRQQLGQQQEQYLQYLRQHTLPSEVLLVGIDPDSNGAIAVVRSQLHWCLTDPGNNSSSNGDVQQSRGGSSNGASSSSKKARSKKAGCNGTNISSCSSNSTGTSIDDSSSSSTAEVPQLQAFIGLPTAVHVYDMPVETIVTQTKTHTGKRRVRRRLDILQAMAVIRQILQDVSAATAETVMTQAPDNTAAATAAVIGAHADSISGNGTVAISSSGSISSTSTTTTTSNAVVADSVGITNASGSSGSSSNNRVLLRAVVEVASILPSNGRLATLNQGYSVGAWTALLASHGFDVTTVHVLSWKKDMGLLKRDKDSSRLLAKALYQQAGSPQDDLLRTKNTHGRAEALLLAAWGLGWSADPAADAPTQGPVRATVHMTGGQHSVPLPQQHNQQQQLMLPPDPSAAAAAITAEDAIASDDDSTSQLLCMPPGMSAMARAEGMIGVVDRARLAQRLQPLSAPIGTQQNQQPPRIADVGAELAAAVAALEAKAAARQAEKEQRAAARKAAAQERAAAKAAEKAAKAAAAAQKAADRAAAKAAHAASSGSSSRRDRCAQSNQETAGDVGEQSSSSDGSGSSSNSRRRRFARTT